MIVKICCKCKRELPIDNFCKDNSQRDKLSITCKGCQKAYRDKPKVKQARAKYKKIYRSKNKDKIKEFKDQWDIDNRYKIKQYIEDNKDRKKIRDKLYKLENKLKISRYNKKYRKKNQIKIKSNKMP
jgi:hypothetical protein